MVGAVYVAAIPAVVLLGTGVVGLQLPVPSSAAAWGHDRAERPVAELPPDKVHRAKASEDACSAGTGVTGTKHVLWKPWGSEDEERLERAMSDGYHFAERLVKTAPVLADSVSFFTDVADSAIDEGERHSAAERGRELARVLERKLAKKWKDGTFGQLLGVRKDLLDTVQVLLHERRLGLAAQDSPLLDTAVQAYRRCSTCFTRGRKIGHGEELDAALEAYVIDEARFRFGKDKFRTKVHPVDVWPKLAARVVEREASFDPATASYVVALAAMASGSGRFALEAGDLEPAKQWVKRHFGDAVDAGDARVVSDLVGVLKLYGCSEETDALVVQGVRLLITQQKQDGRWGDRTAESVGNVAEAGDVLGHLWGSLSALRRAPPRGNATDPYYKHLRKAVDAVGSAV